MAGTTVSVLTPSFNYGRFIGDCLKSVANQTYGDIEHVVVDGGSQDETVALLHAAGDRVRWVSEPDRGQSHALNKALAMSRGEIIGWVNSDDAYADVRAVESAVRIFDAHPEVGAVYGHSLLIDKANRVLQFMWSPAFAGRLLAHTTCFVQPAVFLRRSVLPEPFVRENLRFVMDRDLWLRLLPVAHFQRMDVVAAVDRHHEARKVASQAYLRERDDYRKSGLGRPLPAPAQKALNVALRLRGLASTPGLDRRIRPAIALRFDSAKELALRQAFLPRHRMFGPRDQGASS
jgi:glycosyltransferase involved in cell wall biosynthesis